MSNEASTVPTHAVFYTDGGCDNPYVAGWGVHGYLFKEEPAKQGTGNAKALPTNLGYKTGASGKPDITITHYVDGFGAITHEGTNNVAELAANLNALKTVEATGVQHARLIMDSKYVMDGFDKWMYDWAKNGWVKPDGSPRSNAPLWQQVYELKGKLIEGGVKFTTGWVKGHSGDFGNERADSLATAGKMAARNRVPRESMRVVESQGFWKAKSVRNRMFSHPNWYFAAFDTEPSVAPDGRHVYYTGTIREKSDLTGKAISDASFGVLYVKERDEVLDIVKAGAADLFVGRPQGMMIGYLDQIFKPGQYQEFIDFGRDLLQRDRRNRVLTTKDDVQVLEEIDPPGLSFRLINMLGLLQDRLNDYLTPKPNTQVRITDLTDLLYERESTVKKTTVKLKNTVTSGTKSIKVDGTYQDKKGDKTLPIVLTVAQDLPDRNTLSALADESVKVSLLTWPESERAIRFAVVIESNGDVGIWAGPYSNLQMLPLK